MGSKDVDNRLAANGELTKKQVALGLAAIFVLTVLYGRFIYAPCDDAYIFYVYAKNFAEGNGLTYNGTVVWGFTSILWVGLLTFVGLLGIPIHVGGEILSALSGGFALWATYLLGRSFRMRRLCALAPPLLLSVTGDFAFYSSVGLEQVLFLGLVALSAALVISSMQATQGRTTGIAMVMAAMIMTRPEGALACALLLLVWVVRLRSIRAPFICGLLLVCFIAPFFVAMHFYFDDWLPNTFYVKSNAGVANFQRGVFYLWQSLPRYGLVGALGAAALVYVILTRRICRHINSLFMLTITAVWLMYVTLQGGDNMVGGRVIIPMLPLTYVALIDLAPRIPSRAPISLIGFLCAGLLVSYAFDHGVHRHINGWRTDYVVRQKAGMYLRDHFLAGTIVALNPAGIIPYYSGLPTIDMLGLNDRHIAHNGERDHQLPFGHQAGDGKYVLSQEPDVVLFGSSLSRQPGALISDREIWASPEFHNKYIPVDWTGIGTAYIKKGHSQKIAQPADPGDKQ
jgi:arabinofuranosyltransferase